MTQMEQAKRGRITDEMRYVSAVEGTDPESLRARIAAGSRSYRRTSTTTSTRWRRAGSVDQGQRQHRTSGHHQQLHEEVEKLRSRSPAARKW